MIKNPPANAGDTRDAGLIPGLGSAPGVGNGNSLQYSDLENFMDRGAWQASESQTRLRDEACTRMHTYTHIHIHTHTHTHTHPYSCEIDQMVGMRHTRSSRFRDSTRKFILTYYLGSAKLLCSLVAN